MAEGFSAAREAGMDFCGFLYGLKPVPFPYFPVRGGFRTAPCGAVESGRRWVSQDCVRWGGLHPWAIFDGFLRKREACTSGPEGLRSFGAWMSGMNPGPTDAGWGG